MIHVTSFDKLARSRTPLCTHVIQQIVRHRLDELGWRSSVYSLDASPSALNAVSPDGTMRHARLSSGMSKRALCELLERLGAGVDALDPKPRRKPRKRKQQSQTAQIDLEGWLDAR